MSGIKYILDTNFIISIMKSDASTLAMINELNILASECACSVITRIELLGFNGITLNEEVLIRQKLSAFTCIALDGNVESMTIALRKIRKIKLPDAVIAATTIVNNAQLLTLDAQLISVVNSFQSLAH